MMTKPDIKTIIENEGIELKRRGRDYWANCPFHTDKTPSFKINLERQTWYCSIKQIDFRPKSGIISG